MKHFSLLEWADYVRGVAPASSRAPMQQHLKDGCSQCSATVDMWSKVDGIAKREVKYEPPPEVLRVAESLIVPLALAARSDQRIQIASLKFDSFTSRLMPGLRGGEPGARQIMYQFGDIYIDIRMEKIVDSQQVTLSGQIVDSSAPTGLLSGIPIAVLAGDRRLKEALTSEMGEFHFSFEPTGHVMLQADVGDIGLLMLLPSADA